MKIGSIAKVLVLLGALNWGLVGVGSLIGSDLNVVSMIVGGMPDVEAVVYALIGIAALYIIFNKKK